MFSSHLGLPNDDSCPATIKLFMNKTNMNFDTASTEGMYISVVCYCSCGVVIAYYINLVYIL